MAKINKLGSFLMNASNPANLHIVDINSSIDLYNAAQNLQTLTALQKKVKGYEFAKLSVTLAIEVKTQIDREFDTLKRANDIDSFSRFLAATVNCRAGGWTLQISGGGGDSQGEGGGYASWKECGMESVCQQDAFHAAKFEEVAHELSQKVTDGSLSTPLIAFLNKPSTLELKSGAHLAFVAWIRKFRGQGVCAQQTSSDAKKWLLYTVKEIPHFKPLAPRYTLELNGATLRGEQEYSAYMAEKQKRNLAASRNLLGNVAMPADWQTECFSYGDDSGNWVLQEFVRLNKGKPLPVVSKQYPLVMKAVDDYLLPQLAGKNWRNAKTPTFKMAWDNRDKPNEFE